MYIGALGDRQVGIAHAMIGAPAAAMNLEELISYGARRVYELGFADAIDPALEPGDIVVLKGAFSDEGTSMHYFRGGTWFGSSRNLTRRLEKSLREGGMKYILGEAWTTDARTGRLGRRWPVTEG
jgi:uridine phosphorylase